MNGARILVVEDDLHFGAQIVELFSFLGFDPTLVGNGREAVERFREARFDSVLSDLMLPELNGVDVVKAIRQLPGGDTVPVLMMSAVYRNPKLFERELRNLGVVEFLPKPFSIIDLGRRVSAILDAPPPSLTDSGITRSGSWSSLELRTSLGEAAPDFDVEGSFDRLKLLNLFVAIFEEHQAGCLILRRGHNERTICFLNGYPVWGESSDAAEGLAAVLEKGGELPAAEIQRLVHKATASGRPLREVLLAEGALSERRLFLAERSRVRQVVIGAFAAATGEYRFERGDDFVARVGVFEVNPVQVLSEVVQRFLPLNELAPTVHAAGDRQLARGKRYRQLFPYLVLPPGLERIGADLKAGATLTQLFTSLPGQSDAVLRALWLMLRLGIAEPRAGGLPVEQMKGSPPEPASRTRPPPPSPRTLSEPFLAAATMDPASRGVLSDYLTLMEADFHEVLGVNRSASAEEIRAAYESRMRRYSLTRLPASASSDVRAKAKELLVRLLDAYETLSDPSQRAAYERRQTPR